VLEFASDLQRDYDMWLLWFRSSSRISRSINKLQLFLLFNTRVDHISGETALPVMIFHRSYNGLMATLVNNQPWVSSTGALDKVF
jgi:hypothetical protein